MVVVPSDSSNTCAAINSLGHDVLARTFKLHEASREMLLSTIAERITASSVYDTGGSGGSGWRLQRSH